MRKPALILLSLLLAVACSRGEAVRGDPVAGAEVVEMADPSCDLCHRLASAGLTGSAGPDLDVIQPGYERVLDAVRAGPGLMPSYAGQLSEAEMHDLAAYVSREADR